MSHPDGFHKSPGARARCYSCSAPEKLIASEEDKALARRLLDEGYLSTSNKYRTVSRANVPPFEQAITFSADVPRWMVEQMKHSYESWERWGARVHGEHVVLTAAQFLEFRRIGGQSA